MVTSPVPDLGGWRRERKAHAPGSNGFQARAGLGLRRALSPSTARSIARESFLTHASAVNGQHVWLVPVATDVGSAAVDGGGYRIVGAWHGDAIVHAEPFDTYALHLADLWSA